MYLSKLFQSPTFLLAKPKQAKALNIFLKFIVIESSAFSFELKCLWLLKMPPLQLPAFSNSRRVPKVVLVANVDKIVCDDET